MADTTGFNYLVLSYRHNIIPVLMRQLSSIDSCFFINDSETVDMSLRMFYRCAISSPFISVVF